MTTNAIAIVGMACRFPGASDPEALWHNLAHGVESIRRFTRDELIDAGVSPALADHPRLVSAHGALDDITTFDAGFFGYGPGDAVLIDPQQRLFLECAYEAFERAGIVPGQDATVTGVFGGCGISVYLIRHVFPSLDLDDVGAVYQAIIGGDKDFLTARVAYKLGLTGPAVTVQAACATSLIAVHLACQSLLNGECDLAVAGGASLRVPQAGGFIFSEGGVHSADGHCRAFDAAASGTVGGSGAGAVLLKRLSDAQRDGDPIAAVILGTAVNNDGAHKVSFTAPGVSGQAAVIAEARAVAGVDSTTIGYSELHGTGTAMGDPIEIAAIRQALGDDWRPDWRCYVGSIKTNLGHLDAAAGVAGLIKAVLAVQRGVIPPSLHFTRPNPAIDFESGPLRVATEQTAWPAGDGPRRASVSSFGLGGSNSHAVFEQAPVEETREPARDAWRVFPLSARSAAALEQTRQRLADHLAAHPDARVDDVAWTLARGRQVLPHRGFVVARSMTELVAALRDPDSALTRPADTSAQALTRLGEQWQAGATIEWHEVFAGDQPKRIVLPTYPFERARHWIEPVAKVVTAVPASPQPALTGDAVRFFVPAWTRSQAPRRSSAGRWLVVGGADELTGAVTTALRASGVDVVDANGGIACADGDAILITSGLDGATRVARALLQSGARVREIAAVTTGAADVIGDEPIDPRQAIVLGAMPAIASELPGVGCRVIDVAGGDVEARARAVATELRRGPGDAVVALRHGQRWLPQIGEAPALDAPVAGVVRPHGVYLITGGTGGVGLALARTLASRAPVHLALVSRRGAGEAVEVVTQLEKSGSTVRVYQADCADRDAMAVVVADLRQRHGAIHGVVHAAGVAGGGAFARRTDGEIAAVLRPKTDGADVVAELVPGPELDFLVFCSSLNAYVPVPGQADYSAANAYLDAKAAALRRRGVPAASINWDAWRDVGMAATVSLPAALRAARDEELAAIGLDPVQAGEALLAVVAAHMGQAIVSRRLRITAYAAPVVPETRVECAPIGVASGLAEVWKALLGVPEVKPSDDFFDLGGHSLLATSVVFHIRQTWGCAVTVDELFTCSTFESLTALIEERTAAGEREELRL